ncbi:MAG TPA: YciI family protein [Longimicrobiales bacterium]
MKKYAILIYTDDELLEALPEGQFDASMRDCLAHADELRQEGRLHDSQMLEGANAARSIRVRNGRRTITDGPFTETKELLAGFNMVEAEDMDEAVRMACEFPWAETGCIEVREVRSIDAVRERVHGRESQQEAASSA